MLSPTSVVALLAAYCALFPSAILFAQGELIDAELQVDGRARQYAAYIPDSLKHGGQAPVVFVLHGGGGNGWDMSGYARFDAFAERDRAVVVYPSAFEGFWNDGRKYREFKSQVENVDDVGFLFRVLEDLDARVKVDRSRVFITGHSNGGLMAHMVAAHAANRITAIAPVASSIARPLYSRFEPSRPVPIMIIQDAGDPAVKWTGGETERLDFVSQPKVMARWREVNGCGPSISTSSDALEDHADDATVTHMVWPECNQGVRMEAYIVEANRHAPPSAFLDKEKMRRWKEVVWEFFMSADDGRERGDGIKK